MGEGLDADARRLEKILRLARLELGKPYIEISLARA
jgi:hypothetical protein